MLIFLIQCFFVTAATNITSGEDWTMGQSACGVNIEDKIICQTISKWSAFNKFERKKNVNIKKQISYKGLFTLEGSFQERVH